jgi:hypothetical protein
VWWISLLLVFSGPWDVPLSQAELSPFTSLRFSYSPRPVIHQLLIHICRNPKGQRIKEPFLFLPALPRPNIIPVQSAYCRSTLFPNKVVSCPKMDQITRVDLNLKPPSPLPEWRRLPRKGWWNCSTNGKLVTSSQILDWKACFPKLVSIDRTTGLSVWLQKGDWDMTSINLSMKTDSLDLNYHWVTHLSMKKVIFKPLHKNKSHIK